LFAQQAAAGSDLDRLPIIGADVSLQLYREDEFDATYCYGPGATNQDIHDRTILPLVCKAIEGYNICVLLVGSTGQHCADSSWPLSGWVKGRSCTSAGQYVCEAWGML